MRYMTEKEIFELTDKLDRLGIDYDMEYIWDDEDDDKVIGYKITIEDTITALFEDNQSSFELKEHTFAVRRQAEKNLKKGLTDLFFYDNIYL